jgi:hypothetical protein
MSPARGRGIISLRMTRQPIETKIIVGIDGSERSLDAVAFASALALHSSAGTDRRRRFRRGRDPRRG